MRSSDEVFQLVKSLTKSEKRYFKLIASLQRGEKNYLRLFELLNDMPEYDDDAVRAHFAGQRCAVQLNVVKRYLYDLILKSLRAFHTDSSMRARVREMLTSAAILRQKGLTDHALRIATRAKEIARENELFLELLLAQSTLQSIVADETLSVEECDARYDAIEETLGVQLNLVQYQRLVMRIGRVQLNGAARTSRDRELLDGSRWDPLMDSIDNARSVTANFLHLAVRAHYEYEHANFETLSGIADAQIELFDRHPWFKVARPIWYIATLGNRALLLKRLNEREAYREAMASLESESEELLASNKLAAPALRAYLFKTVHLSLLSYHNGIGTFEMAAPLLPRLAAGMREHAAYLDDGDIVRLNSSAADIEFGRGRFSSALDYINRTTALASPSCATMIHQHARLHALFIHYELGNLDLLDYLIPSTARFLASHGTLERFERCVLNNMGRLARATSEARRIKTLESFRDELAGLMEDPESAPAFNLFHYHAWVQSKLEGRPFATIVEERAMICAEVSV